MSKTKLSHSSVENLNELSLYPPSFHFKIVQGIKDLS